MNRRATIVLLLIAVLLAGFLVLTRSGTLNIGGEDEDTNVDAEADLPTDFDPLFEAAEGDIVVAFSISDDETGDRFAAEFDDVGWVVTETPVDPDENQVIDGTRLDTAARSLTTMVTSRQLSEIESLAQYGLDSTRYTLTFNTLGGGEFTLFLGSKTPGDASYYTQRPGDSEISLVSAAVLDLFVGFLGDPPYVEPTPTVEALPLLTPQPTP